MKNTKVVNTIQEVRQIIRTARKQGKTVGLVPTMGALHAGHASLIEHAAKDTDFVVVSVFVNPTQFGPAEDFDKYPRDLDADLQVCRENNADIIFAPSVKEMYPQPQLAWVDVEQLTDVLCGASRPGHFRGVATVCTKLFNIVMPDVAFFGQKDAQQVVVIKRMVADLNMPLEIHVCPIVREVSGLARSSRNEYLSNEHRHQATAIYKALEKARESIQSGLRDSSSIISEMQTILERTGSIRIEYIRIVDAESLQNKEVIAGPVLIAIAAKVGSTRLIDNILVDAG